MKSDLFYYTLKHQKMNKLEYNKKSRYMPELKRRETILNMDF